MPDGVTLSEAQRRSLGSTLARMEKIARDARVLGFEPPELADLEREIERTRRETAAISPRTGIQLPALLAELFVLATEITPRQFLAYGQLSDGATAYLRGVGERLRDLAGALIDYAGGGDPPHGQAPGNGA